MLHWGLVETEFLTLNTSDHVTRDAYDKLWYVVHTTAQVKIDVQQPIIEW